MTKRRRLLTPEFARQLRLLILDVDGVLTDGGLWFGPRGEVQKRFHVRDGHGVKLLQRAGLQVAVISGRKSRAVALRCRELGIRQVFQGAADKSQVFSRLLKRLKLEPAQVICIGDDTPDVPLFVQAGFAVAVCDAHPLAIAAADRTTTLAGGQGAVREVCDWLLEARNIP